ncbi:MmcQ/YjbR family DNA-binding protein [Saezia sanguinis]|uniref:MmcQ/YjbR family DNA-binding protein n=1 Tax=Saezia sanguinis TaxID=1965230 RepID=UPI003057063C
MTSSRAWVLAYVQKKYNIQPDYPWRGHPSYAVLRHAANKKWFGVVMSVSKSRLGLAGEGRIDVINLKCRPELIGVLRLTPGFLPAYHMNKEHWLTVVLDGTVPEEEIFDLVDLSFTLTK